MGRKDDPRRRAVKQIRCDAYNDDPTRVARVAKALPTSSAIERSARLHQALGHPIRATILAAIQIEPLCVCELSTLLRMSSPALMHHLRILASVGAIEVKKEGKFAVYHPLDAAAALVLNTGIKAA